jgi:hypothetical protein
MGLMVRSATLQSGIPVSNIYACISNSGISVWKDPVSNTYSFNGMYKLYSTVDKTNQPIDNLNINFNLGNIPDENIYKTFYNQLKTIYPDSYST